MTGELGGRTALVTGGGSGIGREAAIALAAEGAAIVVADLDAAAAEETVQAIERKGGQALAVVTDVTSQASVEATHAAAVERFGAVDILVTSAGGNDRGEAGYEVGEIDLERWHAIMRLNLEGTLLCCRAAVPMMKARGWGRIVTIGSAAGYRLEPGGGAYAVSKAAIAALTKVLAKEVGPYGVTANMVVPFFTDTPMLRRRLPTEAAMKEKLNSPLLQTPMNVVLEARDQAAAILYLCRESGRYVTGQSLHVNGGAYMP